MAEGTRKTVSELLASSAPKIAAGLQKRRLIPFKSLPTQMGTVVALTYCLKQHPSLLTLSTVSCHAEPSAYAEHIASASMTCLNNTSACIALLLLLHLTFCNKFTSYTTEPSLFCILP